MCCWLGPCARTGRCQLSINSCEIDDYFSSVKLLLDQVIINVIRPVMAALHTWCSEFV